MVAAQVIGYDTANTIAGASGYLEMNVYKPMLAFNLLQSISMLSDSCINFTQFLLTNTRPNQEKIDHYLHNSLMLVTALSPIIGYDNASKMAHYAADNNCSLSKANDHFKYLSAEEFNQAIDPYKMAQTAEC